MKVLIPSYGRPEEQPAYDRLTEAGADCLIIAADLESMSPGRRSVLKISSHVGETRQRLLEHAKRQKISKFIVPDDDCVFFTRSKDGKKFARASREELSLMIKAVELALHTHAHVGVISRFMGNTKERHYSLNQRYLKFAAYNTDLFPSPWPKFRLSVYEDIDFQLQLATAGKESFILTEYAVDDRKQYAPGGCQRYRTPEVEKQQFEKLAKLWPGIVSFKNGRTRVQWKKAYTWKELKSS